MTTGWMLGTVIPLLFFLYILVGRLATAFAFTRWPNGWEGDMVPTVLFGALWPITVPIWVIMVFIFQPMWRLTSWITTLGEKAAEAMEDDD